METIKLNSKDIEHLQKLGRGACATVYKYGDNLVIKVFNEKGMELHDEEGFSGILGVENGTCIFPQCLVDIDENFQGYAMQYVEGTELQNVIKELDIRTLISAIQKVEEDIRTLSPDKILFEDLNQGGIMWSNEDGIKIIDTDFFTRSDDITEEECFSHNLKNFNTMIEMELGILTGQSNKVTDFLQSNAEYNQLYTDYFISSLNGSNMSVTELLNKATEIFEKEFGVRTNSIAEMETILTERILSELEQENADIPIFEPPTEPKKQKEFIDYDRIIEDMPKNLTQIEKARYIYIQLGKYFSYDERYITSESDNEKREIFDRDIEDIENDKVVCTSLSRIYENLLNRAGITSKTVLIPGERLGHAFTELEIDGKKYFTGLIRDLMNIKTGFKTNEFMIDNPDRFGDDSEYVVLSEEELKSIDDKIGYTYNRYVYGRLYKNAKRRDEFIR